MANEDNPTLESVVFKYGLDGDDYPMLQAGAPKRLDLAGGLKVSGDLNLEQDLTVYGSISGALGPNMVKEEQMCNDAVSNRTLQDQAVDAAKIKPGSVGKDQLADSAVTQEKLAGDVQSVIEQAGIIPEESVTEPKLANDAVSNRTIQNNAVTGSKIKERSINTRELADGAITWEKLAVSAQGTRSWNDGNGQVTTEVKVGIGTTDPMSYRLKVEGGETHFDGPLTVIGTTRLNDTLTVAGKVGIGTPDPVDKLHVGGNIRMSGQNFVMDESLRSLHIETGGNQDNYLHINAFGDHPGVKINQNAARSFDVNRGQLHITSDGKIGIGTTEPGAKLDVDGGDTIISRYLELRDFDTNAADKSVRLVARNKNWMFWNGGLVVGQYRDSEIDDVGTGNLVVKGKVGIGTDKPNEALEINGSVRGNQAGALRIKTATGYTDIGSKNGDWSHFYTDRSKYYFDKEIRVNSGKIGSFDEDLSLCISGNTKVTILKMNGNVGVGTADPKAKLDVNGIIRMGGESTDIVGYKDESTPPRHEQKTHWIKFRGENVLGFRISSSGTGVSKSIILGRGWALRDANGNVIR
ncbi:MAG: hypothetical protein H6632_19710 [Anaerolineales bacterium]|nr:hypothetical protein [Anaerolineales bacterium]